jgi:hypothetical protein
MACLLLFYISYPDTNKCKETAIYEITQKWCT